MNNLHQFIFIISKSKKMPSENKIIFNKALFLVKKINKLKKIMMNHLIKSLS